MYKGILLSVLIPLSMSLASQEAAYEAGKLSPATADFIYEYRRTASDVQARQSLLKRHAVGEQEDATRVNAFVTLQGDCRPETLVELFDLTIQLDLPSLSLITASVPVEQLESLALHPCVQRVEIGTAVEPTLDEARLAGNVDQVHAGMGLPASYTGEGVVVGIVDAGFQYGHIDFYSTDGSTFRVKRVWHTRYDDEGKYETEEEILSVAYDPMASSSSTHATHVAGIAAGADTTQGYHGVAPDAELVFVSYSDNASVLNGIQYVYDYARSVGKPAVVNLSLGSHIGPHDGTSSFDRVCDALQGEGYLLVGAGGNDGGDSIHISKTFSSTDNTLTTAIEFTETRPMAFIDIWSDAGESFTIEPVVCDLTTGEVVSVSDSPLSVPGTSGRQRFSLTDYFGGENDAITIYCQRDSYNNKANAYVSVNLSASSSSFVIGLRLSATQGTVHAWSTYSSFSGKGLEGWTAGDTHYTIGEVGGSGQNIITAGAYTTKNRAASLWNQTLSSGSTIGEIAYFSSLGPTVDGRMKPDIAAPGSFLVSAFCNMTANLLSSYRSYLVARNDGNYYGVMQGTSMAAPYVTGVVATWLQVKPDLTPDEVREVLKETAITDEYTGDIAGVGNNTWGYGKIDAAAGLQKVIALKQLANNREAYGDVGVTQDVGGRRLWLHFYVSGITRATARLYTLNGQLAGSYSLQSNYSLQTADIDVSAFPSGIYVLRIDADGLVFAPKKVALNLW